MDFLFVNTTELTALMELPLIQRVTYLMGIRPYIDRQTCIVGIKRKISHQSLRETLYVAPIAGVKTYGCPSHQQMKRVVKSLELAGLVEVQSTDKNLILKCLLAESDRSVQNKADLKPTPEADTTLKHHTPVKSTSYDDNKTQAGMVETSPADPPHNSVNNFVFLCEQFEKFWLSYPQPQNKPSAWNEFKKLNPDDMLFTVKCQLTLPTHCLMKNKETLFGFVSDCCSGFRTDPNFVIDHLLSVEDEEDIINGDTPKESLKLHIELWIKKSCPHYSGKILSK